MFWTYGFWWRNVLYKSPEYVVLKAPLTQNDPHWKKNNINMHEALEYFMWQNMAAFESFCSRT